MGITRKQPRTSYTVLEPRNTWHIIEGRHYRETVVRRHSDNALRIFLIPEPSA